MFSESVRCVLEAYEDILKLDASQIGLLGKTIAIPTLDSSVIVDLCDRAIDQLNRFPRIIEVSAPTYVVGDLHGNIFDTLRILILSKIPPASKFLFLGDYVDRGEYSVEIVTLLFAMLCAYPEHIVLLRGNHEFEHVNKNYGFMDECLRQFGNLEVWNAVNRVFSYLPFVAIINASIFCVHGGLSPQLSNLKMLKRVERPLVQYEKDDLVCDLVWSDPSNEVPGYFRSNRGSGVTFGSGSVNEFMKNTKMTKVIRAHQCVPLGVERFDGDNVYTVFSCSNYVDSNDNRCGLLFINAESQIQSFSLPPYTIPDREDCLMKEYGIHEIKGFSLAMNLKLEDLVNTSKRNSLVASSKRRYNPKTRSVSMDDIHMHKQIGRKKSLPKLPKLQKI